MQFIQGLANIGINRKRFTKDLLIGLSLANITLLRIWSELLTSTPADGYTMRHPARPVDLAAAMVNVCLLGLLLCLGASLCRRTPHGRAALRWGLPLFLLLPLNAVRTLLANSYLPDLGAQLFREVGRGRLLLLGGVCVAALVIAIVACRHRLPGLASSGLLILSPLLLFTYSQAALGILRYNPGPFADKTLAAPLAGSLPHNRVLWIVFDEMDERLTFVSRDPAVRLPELEQFRSRSFTAAHAFSPSRVTLTSLPALILGTPVAAARELGPADLLLTFRSGETAHWQREPNVFSRAREAGFNTALVGWYHPYGRLLNESLTACKWVERPTLYNSTGERLPQIIANQLRSVLETSLLSPFGQSLPTLHHVRSFEQVLGAATAWAADPRLGLVLVHFPVPHPPYIYSSRTGRCDMRNSPVHGYNDALQLADRSLGAIRTAMQAAGLWESTTVLVTSDHGYRGSVTVDGGASQERWVPFLLKLPGRHSCYEYDRVLQTVHSADLVLEVLRGRLAEPSEVANWFDRQHEAQQQAKARP
jgi:hypothetical protein